MTTDITNYRDDLKRIGGCNLNSLDSELRAFRASPKHAQPRLCGAAMAYLTLGHTGLVHEILGFLAAPESAPSNRFFDAVAEAEETRRNASKAGVA